MSSFIKFIQIHTKVKIIMNFPQYIHPRSQVMGKRPSLYSRTYAESLGCDPEDTSEEILAKLRGLSVAKLQVRSYKLNVYQYYA